MKSNYISKKPVTCPVCKSKIRVKKEAGSQYLRDEHADKYFFITYQCEGCSNQETVMYDVE